MKKRGRPRKPREEKLWQRLDLRVSDTEKEAFRLAAENANQDLSVWIRVQLHRAATQELRDGTNGMEQNGNVETNQGDSNRTSSVR